MPSGQLPRKPVGKIGIGEPGTDLTGKNTSGIPFFFAEPVFALCERKVSFRDRIDSSFHLKQAEKLTSRTARRRLLNGGRGFLGMGGGIICQSKKEQRIQRS